MVAKASIRVEALPAEPVAPTNTPAASCRFHADRNAARSIVRTRVLIPTAAR